MAKQGENIRKRKDSRRETMFPVAEVHSAGTKYSFVCGHTCRKTAQKTQTQLLFKDLLGFWQDSNRIRLKEASVCRYQNLIETHILPELGCCPVNELTTTYLNQFISRKLRQGRIDGKGGLSASYVRGIALVMESAIKYGAAEQLCAPLKSPLTKPVLCKKEISVLSKECQIRLENFLLCDMNEEKLLTYITLYTGLRIGEVLALRWEDIDWSNRILCVRHTLSRVWSYRDGKKHSTMIVTSPKTQMSLRFVPLCSKLFEILVRFYDGNKTGYILSKHGNFLSPRTFENRYKKILKDSGTPAINYHALRHTFATRCIEADVDIKSLSEVLGHADASITVNIKNPYEQLKESKQLDYVC